MSYGGARKGAGRRSQYGCATKPMRVPAHLEPAIQNYIQNQGYQLPLYEGKVAAGYPAPTEDHIAQKVDLNEFLIKHPASTFLVQVSGLSMINAGIYENDILIVDRSMAPVHGKIVVAAIDGQLTVKRLHKEANGQFVLMPENPAFEPITVAEESSAYIWGVVTNVIHAV